jgi:hypothetical protein
MSWFSSKLDWFRKAIENAKMDLDDDSYEDDCDEYEKRIHIPPQAAEDAAPTGVYHTLGPVRMEEPSEEESDDTKIKVTRDPSPQTRRNIDEMNDKDTYKVLKGMRTNAHSLASSNSRRKSPGRLLGCGTRSRLRWYLPTQARGVAIPDTTTPQMLAGESGPRGRGSRVLIFFFRDGWIGDE